MTLSPAHVVLSLSSQVQFGGRASDTHSIVGQNGRGAQKLNNIMYVVYSRKETSCMLNVPFEKTSCRDCASGKIHSDDSVRLQGLWIGDRPIFCSQADGSGGASHVAHWAEPMVFLGGLLSHLPRSRKKTCNFFGARCAIISCRCQRWKSTVFHRFIGSFSTPFDHCECVTL